MGTWKCSKCGCEWESDGDCYRSGGKPVCEDCHYDEVGTEMEKNPVVSPKYLSPKKTKKKAMKRKTPKKVHAKGPIPDWGYDGKIMKPNTIVIAMKGNVAGESGHLWPWAKGDCLLYLGEIGNMEGHCTVVDRAGKVHWGYHTDDFRTATEDET